MLKVSNQIQVHKKPSEADLSAWGEIAQTPEGRRGRKTGEEVRSAKNAIIKVTRREGRSRVRATSVRGRRRGKARVKRIVKDAVTDVCL